MTVNIITIATGPKYSQSCVNMIKSFSERLKSCDKIRFIVFTDNASLFTADNITTIPTESLPRPLNTLLRFNYFLKVKNLFSPEDLIYYADADIFVNRDIDISEIIPDFKDEYVTVRHPWAGEDYGNDFLLCKNQDSKAYLSRLKRYSQGCFFGSYGKSFYDLTEACNENVNEDLENRIISIWHDESHLNKYLCDKKCKILDKEYNVPYKNTPYDYKDHWEVAKIFHYNQQTI